MINWTITESGLQHPTSADVSVKMNENKLDQHKSQPPFSHSFLSVLHHKTIRAGMKSNLVTKKHFGPKKDCGSKMIS